jgi:acyl-CoA synthetase (AMP-forming)/AMP-acid ligase II
MDLGRITNRVPNPWSLITDGAYQAKVLADVGIIRAVRPDKAMKMAAIFARWGATPASGSAVSAILYGDETALIDERGELTFEEVHRRSNALARGFAELGLGPGKGVGLMARNHRGFVETTLAAAKLGANALFLNTRFSGPQLADVMEREGPELLVYDEEFAELLHDVDPGIDRVVAWTEEGTGDPSLDEMIESNDDSDLKPPSEDPRFTILTSGTTGTPKGAQRSNPGGLGGFASMAGSIPYRVREKMVVAAPLFHSWGFTHFVLSLPLSATLILSRKFDEEGTLKLVDEHEAQVLAVVPVMLQRIMNLPEEKLKKYDLSSLRIVSLSGSALPGELATKWMDHFGDNLYNLYGSTEVAYATIAGPEDLREAPGTAGRPPRGTIVRLFDEDDNEVDRGDTGRIFVGNDMAFEGYTGGGGKDEIDGLLSSGDVGHFDEDGRLFIDGRDDEMIVSGGENVFPREVEDLLSDHDAVTEAAVIGVEDEEFGQRLKAFVVLADGKNVGEDEIKGHVKENLAGYKTPREVEFIDELPRNATGKVVKRELVEREKEETGREATTGDSMAEAAENQS